MRFLQALRKEKVDRAPVWFMRQAGRYLPEYREIRAKEKTFMDFCKNHELVIEATLQPFERYPLDAAIIFSDILVIPSAMGMHLEFVKDHGPVFRDQIASLKDLNLLNTEDVCGKLDYVYKSITATKKELKVPLIGFAGSPWTIAVYMLDGKGKSNFPISQKLVYSNSNLVTEVLKTLTLQVSDHLINQAKAGADALMLFDSWAGVLSPHNYMEYSLKYLKDIVARVKLECPDIPIIVFSKGAGSMIAEQADIGCDALGVDQFTSLSAARKMASGKVALQGNLNPYALHADRNILVRETRKVLDAFKGEPGHIFNLGHGIMPDVSPDSLSIVCDTIQSYFGELNG